MLRIALFLLTNLAVMLVASVVVNLLGVGRFITPGGINLQSLLVFCAVFGFAGSLFSLFISKWMAKQSMSVSVIDQPRNPAEQWLLTTVAELAQKAGIKMPEVGIFPAHESNAFATGWNRNDALVAVSTGLLERFDRDEARAVLAHEIGHVANGDMVTLSLIQGVVNTFVMFFARIVGYAVDSFLRSRGGQEESSQQPGIGYYITTMVAEIVFGILASMIVAAFSRYREFRADAAGATLADRNAMIRALQRLQLEAGQTSLPSSMQAFGIAGGMGRLFASHPPLEDRIQALRNPTGTDSINHRFS